ncbi:hypothetical protein Acidovoranil_14740 [Acidovorax sp. FG27]
MRFNSRSALSQRVTSRMNGMNFSVWNGAWVGMESSDSPRRGAHADTKQPPCLNYIGLHTGRAGGVARRAGAAQTTSRLWTRPDPSAPLRRSAK